MQALSPENTTVTVNGVAMAVEDGSYKTQAMMDETTNLLDAGFYSSVNTFKKATGDLKLVYNGDDPPDFDEGDTIALVITTDGPGFNGNVKVAEMTYPVVSPKAAVKYSFSWESNGPYTKTKASP